MYQHLLVIYVFAVAFMNETFACKLASSCMPHHDPVLMLAVVAVVHRMYLRGRTMR